MAQFYASIRGNRGEATRLGTKSSGMQAHIRGWNLGVQVNCFTNSAGEDCFSVALTKGSNGNGAVKHIGNFKESDLKGVEL